VQALGTKRKFFLREYLTWALIRMADAAVAPLMKILKDENPRAWHGAVHIFSKIGDPRMRAMASGLLLCQVP
jgi:HEAT repeat protein